MTLTPTASAFIITLAALFYAAGTKGVDALKGGFLLLTIALIILLLTKRNP